MKSLLTVTAVIEVGTGLATVAIPSLLVAFLFGASISTPVELTLGRVAGVALLALGVACCLVRPDSQSRAARGLAGALALHNTGIAIVLVYAGLVLGLSGAGLWPVVVLHGAMAVWCVMCLANRPAQIIG
jgi:hypothetical protein